MNRASQNTDEELDGLFDRLASLAADTGPTVSHKRSAEAWGHHQRASSLRRDEELAIATPKTIPEREPPAKDDGVVLSRRSPITCRSANRRKRRRIDHPQLPDASWERERSRYRSAYRPLVCCGREGPAVAQKPAVARVQKCGTLSDYVYEITERE